MDKVAMLSDILAQNPADTFARYGLAMEYASQGNLDSSIAEFDRLLESNPEYVPGYFMCAQTLLKSGRTDDAKKRLEQGIYSAKQTGNQHALSEMQAVLDDLV
jgi:tetratricopeptide (TPR) repeat protein